MSTSQQKDDLKRQEEKLGLFCSAKGWQYELISDVGSGLNYKKHGLQSVLDALMEGRIERLVLTYKDRRLCFGAELIFGLCERQGVEVVLIEQTEKVPFEQELAADVIELVTVFSARLHGARSQKTRAAISAVKQALM